jgi:hypothetical protein
VSYERFGPFFDGKIIEEAIKDTLRKWLPTYVARLEFETGREARSVKLPRTYRSTPTFGKYKDDQLPLVMVVCPGLSETPRRNGDGTYDARWHVGVAIVLGAKDDEATESLAKQYGATIRDLLLQHKTLGGVVNRLGWEHEQYDDIPRERLKTLGSAQMIFWVEKENIVNDKGGPGQPEPLPDPYEPYGDWPHVREGGVIVDVQPESIDPEEEP